MTVSLPITVPPSHRFAVVNGLCLHYLDFGGEGKPVVFLHGVTSHAWVWQAAIPRLGDRRMIALDLRGHGDSQWSSSNAYTTEDLASDVIAFVRSITAGSVDLVGASWGGLVGLNVATRAPELIDSLTMVDIPPSFPGAPSEVRFDPPSFTSHGESVAYMRDGSPTMDGALAESVAALGLRPGTKGQLVAKHDGFFVKNRPHRAVDYWTDLEALPLPILIIRAEGSAHLSSAVADEMLKATHDGHLATITETGHRISTDNPEALIGVLRGFLDP